MTDYLKGVVLLSATTLITFTALSFYDQRRILNATARENEKLAEEIRNGK